MNTIEKAAVCLGLAGAATVYAMGGEVRAVQPTTGKTYAMTKIGYDLPFDASGFTMLTLKDSAYGGLTEVSRSIIGPLSGRARISHADRPVSGLEAGLVGTIPTGKLPAFAEAYVLHSVSSGTGTIGTFGTVSKEIAKIRKLPVKARLDAVAEMSYDGLKPTFFFGQVEPSLEVGPVKAGYDFTKTSAGTSHEVFVALKI